MSSSHMPVVADSNLSPQVREREREIGREREREGPNSMVGQVRYLKEFGEFCTSWVGRTDCEQCGASGAS